MNILQAELATLSQKGGKSFILTEYILNLHKYLKKKKKKTLESETLHNNHHENILYNFDPLKPQFYIVKLGFTGVYIIFLISVQKHRLWVLVRTASPRRF